MSLTAKRDAAEIDALKKVMLMMMMMMMIDGAWDGADSFNPYLT